MTGTENTGEINWDSVEASLPSTVYSLFEEIKAVAESRSDDTITAITRLGKSEFGKFQRRFNELRESK